MAKRKCPGCGARYDGKRCPECYYTPFDAQEIPRLHQWEMRTSPQPRKTIDTEYRRTYRRETRRKKPVLILVVLVVILFLFPLLLILGSVTESVVSNIAHVVAEPEPLPMPLPEDGLVLYDSEDIRVILGWNGGEITGDIPVFLENKTNRDVTACTAGVAVNGCMTDNVFFYVDARRNTTSMSQLWIDAEELKNLGISTIGEITLQLEILDGFSYELLNDREIISFGPGSPVQDSYEPGEILFDSDGILFAWQGVQTDEWGNLCLVFYGENNTGKTLDLTSYELLVNGEDSGQYLWQSFFPDTKAVIFMDLYQASELGIEKPEDIEKLEFCLSAAIDERWDAEIVSDPIVIHPREGR